MKLVCTIIANVGEPVSVFSVFVDKKIKNIFSKITRKYGLFSPI
jgi:hypothetical protein